MNNDTRRRPLDKSLVKLIMAICLVVLLTPVPLVLSLNGYGTYVLPFVALLFAACALLLANMARCIRCLSDDENAGSP
jgi:hypothetical protein